MIADYLVVITGSLARILDNFVILFSSAYELFSYNHCTLNFIYDF